MVAWVDLIKAPNLFEDDNLGGRNCGTGERTKFQSRNNKFIGRSSAKLHTTFQTRRTSDLKFLFQMNHRATTAVASIAERRVKATKTMKIPSMDTLCELYEDMVWLRNEVKKLEQVAVHAPSDGGNDQRKEAQAKSVRAELH